MIHIFTHTDLDGVISGLFLSHYFKTYRHAEADAKGFYLDDNPNITVHYCSAGTYGTLSSDINDVLDNDHKIEAIFVTDITPNDATTERLFNSGIPVKIIDHHETSLYLAEKYPDMIINKSVLNGQSTAAATLVYDCLTHKREVSLIKGDILPESLAQITRSYDTWDWALDANDKFGVEARKFDGLLYMYGKEIFISHTLKALQKGKLVSDEDALISDLQLKRDTSYIGDKVKEATYTTFTLPDGAKIRAAVVLGDKLFSEIGNELLKTIDPETNDKTHLSIMVNNGKLSFRSDDVIDSSLVARVLGGGGHPKASGASINFDVITLIQKAFDATK